MQRPPKTIFAWVLASLVLLLASGPGPGPADHQGQRGAAKRPWDKLMEPADHRHAGFAGRDHDDQAATSSRRLTRNSAA